MSAVNHTMPTFCVDSGGILAQIAGMPNVPADKMSHPSALPPAERLRSAGITGFFRATQLPGAGLTRDQLPALLRSGKIERVVRGLYRVAQAEPTENYSVAMACARVPNSVICLLTALRIHGIGTQAPSAVWLAIPHKARAPRLRELRLRIVRFSGAAWTLGVQSTQFDGVPARITSPTRTVVDCFRFERLIGPEAAMEALQDGLRQRKFTIAEISRMVEILPSRRLSAALDVRSI
jgi:predicted transcriptional regulator of viral defense system